MAYGILRWIGDEVPLNNLVGGFSTFVLLIVIAVCILLLSKGAYWMIEGVVSLARRTGLPRIVIGATIVSLGTTTPEAFVSVMAAWMGNPGLALGNGVGSIIVDTGLIFGLTCILAVVPVNRFILNRTGWIQVGSATLLVGIAIISAAVTEGQPVLGRGVGILFLILLGAYMYATYRWAKQRGAMVMQEKGHDGPELTGLGKCWIMFAGGLFLVVVGARILVPSASEIAHRMGVPPDIIAATLVALGTSLPELMTAITAVRRGYPEIMVGNIVGADVLNCFFVIGAAAAAKPLEIPPNFFYFHFPAMLIILYSFRVFIFMSRDGNFRRWHGAWLLGVYLIYVIVQYVFNVGTVD